MKFRTASIAMTLAILACAVFALADQKKSAGHSIFAQDKGRLTIKLDGQTVGHEDFQISSSGESWLAKGTAEFKTLEGAASKVSGSLTLQPDGAPVRYDWSAQTDKTNGAHIQFANGVASITLEMQGARPFQQDLSFNSQLIAVLDNNLYHQYAVLARLYDWSKRGEQSFPVLIPQELTPGTIKVESTGSATAEGKNYDSLKVTSTDLEIQLLLDSDHRLMRLEVPAAKVSVVRD